jgi:DNA-binding transcriptional LysR family regulator
MAANASVSLQDLKDTPFILFDSGFALHRMIIDAARRVGFEPDIVVCSSQVDFMIELAGAGLGVTFLPRRIAAKRRHAMLRQLPLDEPGLEWFMTIAWRRGAYLSAAAKAWLDLVREIHGEEA